MQHSNINTQGYEEKRNSSIDLVKTIAITSVLIVHFFANTGFYNAPFQGKIMFFQGMIRWLTMSSVPLF